MLEARAQQAHKAHLHLWRQHVTIAGRKPTADGKPPTHQTPTASCKHACVVDTGSLAPEKALVRLVPQPSNSLTEERQATVKGRIVDGELGTLNATQTDSTACTRDTPSRARYPQATNKQC